MVENKVPKARFSKDEILAVQKQFKNNEELVYVLRKYLLDAELTEAEEVELRKINKIAIDLIRKNLIPSIYDNTRIGLQAHTLLFNETLTMTPDMSYLHIEAKMIFQEYMENKFDKLWGEGNKEPISLGSLLPKRPQEQEERHINLLAWQAIVSNIDIRLDEVISFAKSAPIDETEEEKAKRLAKNSNK